MSQMYILARSAVTCSTGDVDIDIPGSIVNVIYVIYTLIKIAIPVVLIFLGMLDMAKAVISQKEDEIKKNQGVFVKRLIAAALVFLVFAIVQLMLNIVDPATDNSGKSIGRSKTNSCAKCILVKPKEGECTKSKDQEDWDDAEAQSEKGTSDEKSEEDNPS